MEFCLFSIFNRTDGGGVGGGGRSMMIPPCDFAEDFDTDFEEDFDDFADADFNDRIDVLAKHPTDKSKKQT